MRGVAAEIWLLVSTELGSGQRLLEDLPQDLANGRIGAATALLGNLAEALSIAPLVSIRSMATHYL